MDSVTLTLTLKEIRTLDTLQYHQANCAKCSRPRTLPASAPHCAVGLMHAANAARVIRANQHQYGRAINMPPRETR